MLFGLIISSCTKDDIESEIDNAEKISFVDDLANYTSETNTIIRDDSDSAQIILPNDEELQDLADYLQASLESDIWMPQFVDIYGYPVWSKAIKSNGTEEGFAITLPLIKNDVVIGIMRYINTPDINHAYFRGYNYIVNIPNLEYSEQEIGKAKLLANYFTYFQFQIDSSYNNEIVNWLRSDISNISEGNTTNVRTALFCWDVYELTIDLVHSVIEETGNGETFTTNFFEETGFSVQQECTLIGGSDGDGNNGNTNPDINLDPGDNPAGPNQQVEDCLKGLNANMRAKIKNAVTEIESKYGNKICFDNQDVDGVILLLKAEGVIDCENSDASTIISELESKAEREATRFDKALEDIRNSDISDPCNPELSSDDIVDNAIASMKVSGGCGVDGLESVLSNNDYIEIVESASHCDETMEDDCPKLKNVLDFLVGPESNKPICDFLKDIGASTNSTTKYKYDCDNTKIKPRKDGTYPIGQAQGLKSADQVTAGNIDVYFSEGICDSSCIQILAAVMHESMHAKLLNLGHERLGNIVGDETEFFHVGDLVQALKDSIHLQHKIMAEYYAEEYSKAMSKMFDGCGGELDFMYLAFQGLGADAFKAKGDPLMTPAEEASYLSSWDMVQGCVNTKLNSICQ